MTKSGGIGENYELERGAAREEGGGGEEGVVEWMGVEIRGREGVLAVERIRGYDRN